RARDSSTSQSMGPGYTAGVSYDESEMNLAGDLLAGDVRALARAISLAEDRDPQATALVAELQAHTGRAHLVGVTGSPGGGKSTLVDALVRVIRERGRTVGVIAEVNVVNKADLSGAEKARRLIQDAVAMAPKKPWQPPILLASAVKEEGIGPVWEAIESHRAFLRQSGGLEERRRERLKQEVIA